MIAAPDGTPLRLSRRSGAVPHGPVVLLGHGPSVHSALLAPAIEAFAARAAEVWAGDLRGHGGSVSGRAPLAHLDPETGWARLLDDLDSFARRAFDGVPRARRLLIGGGLSGHLMLDLLARNPALAAHLVLAGPTPHQPAINRIGLAFLRMRSLSRPLDRPDPQFLHHLYGFLRAQLPPGGDNHDTISADPEVLRAIRQDPRGFPTPTPGYWRAILPAMFGTYDRIGPGALPADLRVLVLSGPEDPQTRGGRLIPRLLDWLRRVGVAEAGAAMIEGVRANVLIDAPRRPVVPAVMDWFEAQPASGGATSAAAAAPRPAGPVLAAEAPPDAADPYLPALQSLGLATSVGDLASIPVLIDLCYAALEDDSRWIELIYRLSLGAESRGQDAEALLEAIYPHWQRAYELREALRQAAMLGRLYHDLIDRLDLGVAVLDSGGRLRHANPAFAQTLAQIDAAAAAAPEGWLQRALRAPEGEPGADIPLVVDGQVVGISLVPASLGAGGAEVEPAGRLVVLRLADSAPADLTHRAGLLALAYGLTGQEGAVALHLAEGRSTAAAARAMGVSENTLRSHLKQVFDKIGVSSRTELIHRVLTGPLGWLSAPTTAAPLAAPTPGAQQEPQPEPRPGPRPAPGAVSRRGAGGS